MLLDEELLAPADRTLLCRARTNREIARRLCLTQAAVKADIASMVRKMGVSSRLDVVVEAYRRGLADC